MDEFYSLHGLKGAVISAVDLIKGIGIGAGMQSIDVEGATGTLSSNFDGKAQAGIEALKENDFLYVHLEAPDECGHQGDYNGKVRAIELIDEKIVTPIVKYLNDNGIDFKIAILPDHATPIVKKTHVSDPMPYLIYDSQNEIDGVALTEENATGAKNTLPSGVALVEKLLG